MSILASIDATELNRPEPCTECFGDQYEHVCKCSWKLTVRQCKEWGGMCISCQRLNS